MTEPALALEGFELAHRRRGGDLVLLRGVDLEVPAGGFYLLIGESGSGKSSVLRLLTGLVSGRVRRPRTVGSLKVLGREVSRSYPSSLRGEVAAILQDEGLLDEMSPRENVELALWAHQRSLKLAPGLLAQVGLVEPPSQVALLSGGQRKRAAVARALAAQPRLLFCDEPTAGLDGPAAAMIARLLKDSHTEARGERTTVVITHDVRAFDGLADGVLLLDARAQTLRFREADDLAPAERQPVAAGSSGSSTDVVGGLDRGLLVLGSFTRTLVESVLRLPPVFPGQTARTVGRFLIEPIVFVCLACAVIGGLATFFALRNNPLQGAFQAQVLTGAGKVLFAVLVPLLAGFFVTARMAAGAAARIGTMQRTGQVAALRMMGIRPVDFLLTPLTWALTLAMPVVTLAAVVASSFASLLAARWVAGVTADAWAPAFFRTVQGEDLLGLLLKSSLSGYLVAVLTFFLGTAPKRSGADVGRAVNSSIVLGMCIVLVVHSLITFFQFS